MSIPPARFRPALLACLTAALLVACTGADAAPTPTDPAGPTAPTVEPTAEPTPTAGPTAPEPPVDSDPIVGAWGSGAPPVDLGDGLVLADCEGDAPTLCVSRGGDDLGYLEHLAFPVPPELAGLEGAALDAALRVFAEERSAWVAEDRAEGCGADHEVLQDAPASLTVAGAPGLRHGFTTLLDGEATERHVTWVTVGPDALHLVVAAAVAPGACMDDGLTAFEPSVIDELLPVLDRVMAGTPLPPG